ncbi:MAG TPA: sensor domain-containing protein [Thermoanaerobaculia bacterium]|nr:sensor domain-containing protein [Thermoanaerobaculia bacterium]
MNQRPLAVFFGVLADRRTYLGLVYLLLAFPLGVAYFVFLASGISLGVGLFILWIGAALLLGVIGASFGFSLFERLQATWLLDAELGPTWQRPIDNLGFWARVKAMLANRLTWTGMLFQLLKFPLGLASFVFLVVTLSVSGVLVAAPFYYAWSPPSFGWGVHFWQADTLPRALVCSLLGAVLLIGTLHAVKGLAFLWRKWAGLMLGRQQEKSSEPADQAWTA